MSTEVWLITLKYFGSVIGAAYGLYATLTDFHEQKGGKKILSKKGKYGISILVFSSLLTLITTALSDFIEKNEKEKAAEKDRVAAIIENRRRDSALRREVIIINSLTEQLKISKNISDSTGKISNELGIATETIHSAAAKSTNAALMSERAASISKNVLLETVNKIEYLEAEINFCVNPYDIFYDRVFGFDSAWVAQSNYEWEALEKAIEKHYVYFKNKIFQHWIYECMLSKEKVTGVIGEQTTISSNQVVAFFRGFEPEQLHSFQIIYPRYKETALFANSNWGILCRAKYRITVDKTSGITKYQDLNNLWWFNNLSIGEVKFSQTPKFIKIGSFFLNFGLEKNISIYEPIELGANHGDSLKVTNNGNLDSYDLTRLVIYKQPIIPNKLISVVGWSGGVGLMKIPNNLFKDHTP